MHRQRMPQGKAGGRRGGGWIEGKYGAGWRSEEGSTMEIGSVEGIAMVAQLHWRCAVGCTIQHHGCELEAPPPHVLRWPPLSGVPPPASPPPVPHTLQTIPPR
eukprot:1196203-Prorocentrum_minimum.AAC.2